MKEPNKTLETNRSHAFLLWMRQKTFDSSTSGEQVSSQIADLLDKLRAMQKPRFSTYLLPFVLAAAFGLIAWSNGRAYAVVYFGALTVAFVLHDSSRRSTRREIALVAALLGAQQKKHDSTNATQLGR